MCVLRVVLRTLGNRVDGAHRGARYYGVARICAVVAEFDVYLRARSPIKPAVIALLHKWALAYFPALKLPMGRHLTHPRASLTEGEGYKAPHRSQTTQTAFANDLRTGC
jgi:hypothetical protein